MQVQCALDKYNAGTMCIRCSPQEKENVFFANIRNSDGWYLSIGAICQKYKFVKTSASKAIKAMIAVQGGKAEIENEGQQSLKAED